MGNVNMEAYQVHYEGKSVAEKLKELDAIAQQIEDLPTFTSNDRVFLEAVPAMPTEDGEKFLKATTADGETTLSYDGITIPEGFEVKKKDYIGDGQTTKAIDFGTETPKMIIQIVTDPAVDQANGDWHCIPCFPWGSKMSEVRWNVGSNNAPNVGGNGGNYAVGISYSGNVMTITGRDAGGTCNITDRHYSVYYVV